MNFAELGIGAMGLIVVLFTIYFLVACHGPDNKNYGPLVGLGIFVFCGIFVMVLVMYQRMQITEKLYLLHLELKTECELVIPRSDNCIPIIQYVPEQGD